MKSPWVQLTVALMTICSSPIVPCQAEAQQAAADPGMALAQAYERIDTKGTFQIQSEKA
jgi:hypothetical protein